MKWSSYVSYFFGGAFLANAVPHFVSGMSGRAFQTPFADPPGRGLSSSTVNALWGGFNIAVGYVLIVRVGEFDPNDSGDALAAGSGILAMAVTMSRVFGELHGGNAPS